MERSQELIATRLARRTQANLLMSWSIGSIIAGITPWIMRQHAPFLDAAASQFFIWGAIDGFFAFGGIKQATRADHTPIDEISIQIELADRDKLLGFLKFNAYLNYLWVGTGLVLLAAGIIQHNNPALLGHGTGVTLQGGFLFLIDRRFVRWLRTVGASAN